MGQDITVTVRRGASPFVVFFDLDRSLTGMAIERYPSLESAAGARTSDLLARRLLELGATNVTVYSNVVTVEAPPERCEALVPAMTAAIEHLFRHYGTEPELTTSP